MPIPLKVSAAPATQAHVTWRSAAHTLKGGYASFITPARTKVVDEHSSHHGAAAAAQAKVQALQDALRRRPQGRRDSGTQVRDTGGPN